MNDFSFKSVHASVRPARVAILVDRNDADWQNSCLRIIEFYSRLWGGAHNIIVPTDGTTIDEQFWKILEAFDPDYLYRYQKSGEDLRRSNPERYRELLMPHIEAAVESGSYADAAAAEVEVDKRFRDQWLTHFEISQTLQDQIKTRLAPFWFEAYGVYAGAISAGTSPAFPLTDLVRILPNAAHPDIMSIFELSDNLVPALWLASVTGLASSEMSEAFAQVGVRLARRSVGEDHIKFLIELAVTGDIRRARAVGAASSGLDLNPGTTPFNISMLELGLYRSTKYRDWQEPLVLVVGNSFDDFCLYYCLSRLRDRVTWVLPSITEQALGHTPESPFSSAEMHYTFEVSGSERSNQHAGGTATISFSLAAEQVDKIIFQLSRLGARQYATQIRKTTIDSLIKLPLAAIERDNFQRDVAVQLSGDRSISPLNTPKPKHFNPIDPYEHRYITQLSIAKEAPPRHYTLGTWIISDRRLTTLEARIGREGPAYFCPNIAYFGGDIDTVLVRPNLHLPPLSKIVEELAADKGYECHPSDKGIYADESISKWEGLEALGTFLRNKGFRTVLERFLDESKSAPGKGVFLNSVRRRFLDFPAIKALIGSASAALIDEMVSKQILYRGFIFGCEYCKNVDWFSVSEVTQQFLCRRCGRAQIYTRPNWRQPDEPAWFYKLDELIYLGYRHGMAVSLLALDYLRMKSENSFSFVTDREFWKPDAEKPEVEADFFCAPDGILTVGEAKKENSLGKSSTEEAAKIKKYRHLVAALAVQQLVFATESKAWQESTVSAVKSAFADVPYARLVFLDASHLLAA